MKELPIFKGYTVDFRLRQFRKVRVGKVPEFIDFKSPKGDTLLSQMIRAGLVPQETLIDLF